MPVAGLWMCVILPVVCGCGGGHDKAKVMVITTPPGARVFLNRKLIGTSPVKCSVVDRHPDNLWEHHVIEARRQGYEPAKKELRYRTGAAWLPKKIAFTLEKIEGYVPQSPIVATKNPLPVEPATAKVKIAKSPAPAVKKPKKPAAKLVKVKKVKKPVVKIKKNVVEPAIVKVEIVRLPAPSAKKPRKTAAKICKKPAVKIKKSASPQLAGKTAKCVAKTKPPRSPNGKAKTLVARMSSLSFAATATSVTAVAPPKQPGKIFMAAIPWTQAAPPGKTQTTVAAKIDSTVQPPAADQRLACELRIIRVADKQVMGQTSALAVYGKRAELAEIMIRQLLQKIPEGKMVTAICLRNRRQTKQGRFLSDKMTTEIYHALKRAAHFQLVDRIDLRPIFRDETKLESARHITGPGVLRLLGNVDYVLLGGVAMAERIPDSTIDKKTLDIKPQNGF